MAGQFKDLIVSGDVGKVTLGIEDAITLSFITNPMREMTKAEISRRFRVCSDIFMNLRRDFRWSVPKILDLLPTYLKCELDGVPYDPSTIRDSWSAEGVDRTHDVPRLPGKATVAPVDDADDTLDEAEEREFAQLVADVTTSD